MKTIDCTIKRYRNHGYNFDVIYDGQEYEVWVHHKDCGHAVFLYSLFRRNDETHASIMAVIRADIDAGFETYKMVFNKADDALTEGMEL